MVSVDCTDVNRALLHSVLKRFQQYTATILSPSPAIIPLRQAGGKLRRIAESSSTAYLKDRAFWFVSSPDMMHSCASDSYRQPERMPWGHSK
jgi:hypothetical protein